MCTKPSFLFFPSKQFPFKRSKFIMSPPPPSREQSGRRWRQVFLLWVGDTMILADEQRACAEMFSMLSGAATRVRGDSSEGVPPRIARFGACCGIPEGKVLRQGGKPQLHKDTPFRPFQKIWFDQLICLGYCVFFKLPPQPIVSVTAQSHPRLLSGHFVPKVWSVQLTVYLKEKPAVCLSPWARPAGHSETHASLILVAHGTFVAMELCVGRGAKLQVAPLGTKLSIFGKYSHNEWLFLALTLTQNVLGRATEQEMNCSPTLYYSSYKSKIKSKIIQTFTS